MLFMDFTPLLVILFFCNTSANINNNVCRTFNGYYFPYFNKNCYYDPDTTLSTQKLIQKYTNALEIHDVTTEDGYIVRIYRIVQKEPKGVILLHHSLGTYSRIYMWQSNNSLAVTLWRNGFDVWLPNQRGTTDSVKHVNMTSSQFKYWDFSFDEMGIYGVSAELKYIRSKTNNAKIIFYGHSLGSDVGLVYASMKPAEAKNYLKGMVLLAAPVYFKYATSESMKLKGFTSSAWSLLKAIRWGSPARFLPVFIPISRLVLRFLPFILTIGRQVSYAFCGYTPKETDPTFFNYDTVLNGNNFSWKTLIHFGQLSNSGKFQRFDYGQKKNMKIYGHKEPPQYPLKNISVPILLISSYNDSLISSRDSDDLYKKLPKQVKPYGYWKVTGLNHLHYLIGITRREIYLDRLMNFLKNL